MQQGKERKHKRDEDAISKGEQLCFRLLDLSSQFVFRLQLLPRPEIQYLSSAVSRLLGGTSEDYFEDPDLLFSRLYPKDRQEIDALLDNPGRVRLSTTLRFIRDSGDLACLRGTFAVERNAQGRAGAVEGILEDVTVQTLSQEEQQDLLHISEIERRWVQTVLRQSPVALLLVRKGRQRLKVEGNYRFDRLLPSFRERPRDPQEYLQVLRRPSGEPIAGEELPSTRALQGETVQGEEYIIDDPLKRTPVLVRAVPVTASSGDVIGAMVAIEDISEQKELERMRREWSHVIAHDLKQPLSNILLFSSMMEASEEVPEKFGKPLSYIRSSAEQLNRMVDDLADLSRLEAKNLKLERQEMALPPVLAEIADKLQHQYPARPIRIRVEPDLPPVEADRGRLEQVFTNLVSNALKYGYSDTPVLIDCRREGSRAIQVSVCNEGEGLTAEELPLLFQRFQRVKKGAFAKIKGTGLGLYLSRGLVEAHGGEIRVESEPAKTTTFHVFLPVFGAEGIDNQEKDRDETG